MTEVESPRYSYLRYSYEVVPTKPLADYLGSITDIINDQIPSANFRVSSGSNRSSKLKESKQTQDKKLIPVKFQPYSINTLRFTLFEQRLLRSQANNRKLEKLSSRLNNHRELFEKLAKITAAASLEEGMGPEVIAKSVEETTRPIDTHLGREFGVAATGINTGIAMLLEQSGVVYEVAKSLGIGNEIIDTKPPEQVVVPFVRLPYGMDGEVTEKFVASANEALPKDGLDILFSPDMSISPMIRRAMR